MKKLLPKTSANLQGFTLVELMVVIAIIAILSAIGMTIFTQVQVKARNSRRIADVQSIGNASEIYYGQGSNKYPVTAPTLTQFISGSVLPKDPKTNLDYKWTPVDLPAVGVGYYICATLEDPYTGGNSTVETGITPGTAATNKFYCAAQRQ